jgi:bifunctional non-homologous end joining protein LigD
VTALDLLDDSERALIKKGAPPSGSDAMRAKLTDERFSDPEWIYERKLDGIRCIGVRDGGKPKLWSRNNLSLDGRYPEIVDALGADAETRFAVDGEVVAFDRGQTSFARLAARGHHRVAVFYYVFDILWLDGYDLRRLPLLARKRLLRKALGFKGHVRLTAHRNRDGEEYFREACKRRWEGVIAKRADSTYTSARSADWLKFKCEHGQELVIGGYTAPRGSRTRFGALLVGHYDGDALRYAGKVGTGFDQATLDELGDRMEKLQRATPPFADPGAIRERAVTWVKPELVAQIGFTEWTDQGRLRHPRFQGMRDDKAAREVVREAP